TRRATIRRARCPACSPMAPPPGRRRSTAATPSGKSRRCGTLSAVLRGARRRTAGGRESPGPRAGRTIPPRPERPPALPAPFPGRSCAGGPGDAGTPLGQQGEVGRPQRVEVGALVGRRDFLAAGRVGGPFGWRWVGGARKAPCPKPLRPGQL